MELIETQVRMQYRLLKHQGYYSRVRASNEKGGKEELLQGEDQIVLWASQLNGKANLYISRNPFTKDGAVAGVSCFSLDIDPIREPQRASSDEQLARAEETAADIRRVWGPGDICTSGNGVLLIYPFGELVGQDIDAFVNRAQEFERGIIKNFSTREVRIDATNYAKALLRLMGTQNVKDPSPDKRRYARFLRRPVFRAVGSPILERIKGTAAPQSVSVLGLPSADSVSDKLLNQYDKGEPVGLLADRSAADYALACRLQLEGLGPQAVLEQLSRLSFRPERTDDHRRIVEKIFAKAAGMQTTAGLVSRGTGREELWTPGTPIVQGGSGGSGRPISTGSAYLDRCLNGGYRPGVVYGIYGATNSGKSAYLIQACRLSCERGVKTLLVTTEASVEEVCQRYFASGTGLPTAQICNGSLDEYGRQKLDAYQRAFRETHKLWIHYTTSPQPEVIAGYIDDVKPDLVLWDYFQHFETTDGSRQTQLAALARWFESTAITKKVPIVVGAQLHERFDGTKRAPANKAHLKDCTVLSDAAKVVIVLDWDWKNIPEGDGPVSVKLDIQKNKGPQGSCHVLLDRATTRLQDL